MIFWRKSIGKFQDEIRLIRQEQKKRSLFAPREEFVLEAEAYISYLCDAIRRKIKLAAEEGRVQFDVRDKYIFPGYKRNPHYWANWIVRCEVDFTKDDFYWNKKDGCLMLSEVWTLQYILREIETRLKEDDIYPVECNTRNLDLFGQHTMSWTVHRPLRLEEGFCEILKAAENYERANGEARGTFCAGSGFAYFIQE